MDDRALMESLLVSVKGANGLFLHGTVESSSGNVRNTFESSLKKSLQMQNDIYTKMSDKGWYQVQPAPQQQIDQTAQKFTETC